MASRKDSPSPKTSIASDAIAVGCELGYDVFSLNKKLSSSDQRFYVFGRYDYYDSMYKTVSSMADEPQWGRQKMTFGFNYYPMKEIVIKGEWSKRMFKSQFNDEPTVSLGVCYYGMFHL